MGTCLSKKKGSSSSFSPVVETKSLSSSAPSELKKNSANVISVSKPKVETEPQLNPEKDKKTVLPDKQEPVREDEGGQVKKEIFIIKHRKSHDDRERNSKCPPTVHQNASVDGVAENEATIEAAELIGTNKIVPPASAPSAAAMGVGVRTSSCTKEEVDAILIQCGRLSRSSSGKTASSSAGAGERRRRYSGSKRSFDFDHCDNDTISADDDQRRAKSTDNSDPCEDDGEKRRQHRPRDRQSPRKPSSSHGRRRTPSRERDQQQNQRSSSRERRVSRSPGRRSSETSNPPSTNSTSAIAGGNNSNSSARPGKMVSVPPTVSSLVMDKSNNGGGGESGVKKISVKRNVGDSGMVGSRSAASPRSQSPARANGNAASSKALGENNPQQQPSLSRNSSRKADQSPYRRNPLSEIDPNSLAYPQSANTNNRNMNVDVNDNAKSRTRGVGRNCKPKEQHEEEVIGHCPMTENIVVKTVVPSGIDNLKQSHTLTRSRSSRRSRDLDINPEAMLNPEQSYTSLLLEDIQNFHQKSTATPPVSLPACVTKACSILEAVADLNSTNSSNLLGPFSDDRKSPPTCQSTKNDYNGLLGSNHYGKKRITDTKDPFVESEVVVHDDVMEPSFHKYVTVKRGGSVRGGGGNGSGADMEDQESSGSNSFTVSGQQNWGFSSSSWEPNSADSTDCWSSRLNSTEEEVQKGSSSWASEAGRDMEETRKKSNGKRRECDHQHSGGIGRGRLGADKSLHTISATAAATT
ncbi:uncharacterized protein At1g65710-like [Neltuma alba]|uniref:uncharacterized protein At1g65710-like n=1 Tax=Neltuma alba TaxID=207710 RepID=UPI0010A2F9A6|nr:uncharacterized protein At1g65710-like [Prosopis alba]